MRRSAVTRRLSILPATLLRAVRLVWLSDRRLAFWHTALTAIQALLPLGTLFALKQVIDIASRLFQNSERFSPFSFSAAAERFASDPDFRQLTAWAFFGALCLVLVALARLLSKPARRQGQQPEQTQLAQARRRPVAHARSRPG